MDLSKVGDMTTCGQRKSQLSVTITPPPPLEVDLVSSSSPMIPAAPSQYHDSDEEDDALNHRDLDLFNFDSSSEFTNSGDSYDDIMCDAMSPRNQARTPKQFANLLTPKQTSAVSPSRHSLPIQSLMFRPDLNMQEQEGRVHEYKLEQHQRWIDKQDAVRNISQNWSARDQRQAFCQLLVEGHRYQEARIRQKELQTGKRMERKPNPPGSALAALDLSQTRVLRMVLHDVDTLIRGPTKDAAGNETGPATPERVELVRNQLVTVNMWR